MQPSGKSIIFSAPSGAGKTSIIKPLMGYYPQLELSVSATCRQPRPGETDGVEYHFITLREFNQRRERGDFIEWEEVFPGIQYGTLRQEVERIWSKGRVALFDIDVKGAMNLKRAFGGNAITIFIEPPSIDALRQRLESRGTESPEVIAKRLARAESEMAYAPRYDRRVVNDDLERAVQETVAIVGEFLGR
ncbi:MAG: guanylate kinase [Bacteroidia bacterium]|nr:guanylate kinase [Bacteroidia bacterium]